MAPNRAVLAAAIAIDDDVIEPTVPPTTSIDDGAQIGQSERYEQGFKVSGIPPLEGLTIRDFEHESDEESDWYRVVEEGLFRVAEKHSCYGSAAVVKSVPPRANSDFSVAVEKKGHLDQSPVFYEPKPHRKNLLDIKYLGVLKAEGKGDDFDRIVEKNAKRMEAAISINKPDADAFAWPITEADEEADLKRRQSEMVTNVDRGISGGEEENEEKHLLIAELLRNFTWEEGQRGSNVVQRLPCETLLWQCRAKHAGDLRYGQGCPHQLLHGPFRARLKQFTNFQKAIMDAIESDKPIRSNDAKVWLAEVPENLKAQVTDVLSEAREIRNDLVRLRKLSHTYSEFAGRLEGSTDGGFGRFGHMYSKILHQKLQDDSRSTRASTKCRKRSGDASDSDNEDSIDKEDSDTLGTSNTAGMSSKEHSGRVVSSTETSSGTASFQVAIDSCWESARRRTSSTYTRSTGGRSSRLVDENGRPSPGTPVTAPEDDPTTPSASTQWPLDSGDLQDSTSNGTEVPWPLVHGATLPAPKAKCPSRRLGIPLSSAPGQPYKPPISTAPSPQREISLRKTRTGTLKGWKSFKYGWNLKS